MEKNKIPIRFFVIAFLWSWIILGIIIFLRYKNPQEAFFPSSGIEYILAFFGVLGPAVGAIISKCTIEGKGSLKPFFKSFLILKFGWKVWLSIFLVLGISSFIAWIMPEFFGEERAPRDLPNVYIFPLYLLLMVFLGGGQEEIGWRGYISPYLEKKFGLIIGALVLGIIWSVWHLPLWFIPGSSHSYMNFFAFMLGTIGYSYYLSWIIEASGNRLMSGLIAHGAGNAFPALFPYLIMAENVKQTRLWIFCFIITAVGIIIVVNRVCKSKKTST